MRHIHGAHYVHMGHLSWVDSRHLFESTEFDTCYCRLMDALRMPQFKGDSSL